MTNKPTPLWDYIFANFTSATKFADTLKSKSGARLARQTVSIWNQRGAIVHDGAIWHEFTGRKRADYVLMDYDGLKYRRCYVF